jgi:hypothetical protein
MDDDAEPNGVVYDPCVGKVKVDTLKNTMGQKFFLFV